MRYVVPCYAICLLCSTPGVVRDVYLWGLCYAAGIAAQSMAATNLHSASVAAWPLAPALLMPGYGRRPGADFAPRNRARGDQDREATTANEPRPHGLAAKFRFWLEWSLCSLGLGSIPGTLTGATRRLVEERAVHYAMDGSYTAYRRAIPVLLPFLPIRTLCVGKPLHR